MPKYAARTDGNQSQIVDALRQVGATVIPCHAVGQGFPDIMVGYQGRNWLMEIKDPSKPKSGQKLTKSQEQFHEKWRGQVVVVRTVIEALAAIGIPYKGTIS